MSYVIPRNMPAVASWLALWGQGNGAPVVLEHAAIGSVRGIAAHIGLRCSRCVAIAKACGISPGSHI